MPSTRAPAEVVTEPGSFGAADELLETAQMLGIGRGHGAEVHGDAVLDDAILLENLIEHGQWAAGVDHEVLRDDFEPVDDGLAREDVLVMRNAEADSDAVVLKRIEAISGHRQFSGTVITVASGTVTIEVSGEIRWPAADCGI